MISTSAIRISCVVAESKAEQAVQVLHEAFELDRASPAAAPPVVGTRIGLAAAGVRPRELEAWLLAGNLGPMRIGVVGATGQVGGVMRRVLVERDFPVDEIRYFASARSAGRTPDLGDAEVVVEDAATADFAGLDIALFSAGGATSRELAPRGRRGRCRRHRQLVGLADGPRRAAGGVRGQPRRARPHRPKGIVANPNCTTMAAMPVLEAARTPRPGSRRSSSAPTRPCRAPAWPASTSSTSRCARRSTTPPRSPTTAGRSSSPRPTSSRSRSPSTCCRSPGSLVDDGRNETDEEQKLRNESRKILDIPDLAVSGTCVRVPVFTGHSLSINAQFDAAHLAGRGHRGARGAAGRASSPRSPRRSRRPAPTRRFVGRIRPTRRSRWPRRWRCSCRATTCARAPRSTRCRSPSSSPPSADQPCVRRAQVHRHGAGTHVEPAQAGVASMRSAMTVASSSPRSSWRKWPAPSMVTCGCPLAPGTSSWKTRSQPAVAGSPSE